MKPPRTKDDTSLTVAEQRLPVRNTQLRLEAGLVYMSDPNGMTLAELSDHPRVRGEVTLRTLERWCAEDQWVEKRAEFLAGWADEARKQLGSAFVQARRDELEILQEVTQIALEKIRDDLITQPKSLEGMIKALVEVQKRRDVVQTSIAQEVMPAETKNQDVLALPEDLPIGKDELAAMAKAAMKIQREKVRAVVDVQADEVIDIKAKTAEAEEEEDASQ